MTPFSALTPLLRPAQASDCDLLLQLRNLPEVCRFSRSPDPIPAEEHARWFKQALTSPSQVILMIEVRGKENLSETIGSVRLDKAETDGWRISIFVHPDYQGQGLGKWALLAAEKFVPEQTNQKLLAEINAHNLTSLRLFEAAGYLPQDTSTSFRTFKKPLMP